MNIECRSAADFDLDQITDFYREHYPHSPYLASGDFLRWRYSSPLGNTLQQSVVAVAENRIIGFMGAIGDKCWDGTRWHEARWLVNLMIRPQDRGGLAALRMFQYAMRQPYLLQATGVATHLLQLYRSLGWCHVEPVDTFYLLRRPTGLIRWAMQKRQRPKWQLLVTRLAWPFDVTHEILVDRAAERERSRHQIEPIHDFASISKFAEATNVKHGVTSSRSAEYLQWKFSDRPVGIATGWRSIAERGDGTTGYMIAKPMKNSAAKWLEIVDFVVEPRDVETLCALVSEAQREMARCDLEFARVRCSVDEHKQFFQSTSWLKKTMPVSDDIFCYSKDRDLMRRMKKGPWHFTSIVSDRADYGADEWEDRRLSLRRK